MGYLAIKLTKDSRYKLLKLSFKNRWIPLDWWVKSDHCTLWFGPMQSHFEQAIGHKIKLDVIGFGENSTAKAVKIGLIDDWYPDGIVQPDRMLHITLAINKSAGGKPVDSNNITKWHTVPEFKLEGVIGYYENN